MKISEIHSCEKSEGKEIDKITLKKLRLGVKRFEKGLCPNCGKKMIEVEDSMLKKKTGYIWHCSCMPDNVNLMIL